MPAPVRSTIDGILETCAEKFLLIEQATTEGMVEAGEGLLEELRDLTFAAGLGTRLPYTWKLNSYPKSGHSLAPAAYIYSKAPGIIDFFSAQRVVTPIGGAFAIPVSPVVKRGGKPMDIHEVQRHFGQQLEWRRLKSGNIGLFADLMLGKSTKRPGFRRVTPGRLKQGRESQKVLLFVLVRSLRTKKLIDLDRAVRKWADRVPILIDKRLEKIG